MRTVCLVAVIALATGCATVRPEYRPVPRGAYRVIPQGIEQNDRMIEAVRKVIPDGTPIFEARRVMESAGFQCSLNEDCYFTAAEKEWDDIWLPKEPNPKGSSRPQPKYSTGLNYLYCGRAEIDGFTVPRRWKVTLVHEEGSVVGVRVEDGWPVRQPEAHENPYRIPDGD